MRTQRPALFLSFSEFSDSFGLRGLHDYVAFVVHVDASPSVPGIFQDVLELHVLILLQMTDASLPMQLLD